MKFKTGDKVKLVGYNSNWDGTEGIVTVIEPNGTWYDKYMYSLTLTTDTPTGHVKAGEYAGRWSDNYLEMVHSPQDKVLAEQFPGYLDLYKSKKSGNWIVLDEDANLFFILVDGEVEAI